MDLSIIVPIYNVEKYVRTCIESIFKQGLDENNFEVIIVNDGTKDRSMEIIADIISEHNNITIINQENQGLSVARNNGMSRAKGKYILMPDSDDLLPDNSVKPLLEYALRAKPEMIVADYLTLSDSEISQLVNHPILQPQEFIVEDIKGEEMLTVGNCRFYWRILYRKDFLQSNNISFYPGILGQDIPFTAECFMKVKDFKRASWILYLYRRGHTSSSILFNQKKANDQSIAIAKTWELTKLDKFSQRTMRKHYELMFNLFYAHLYAINWGHIKNKSEKIEAIKFFKQKAPANMRFYHSFRQVAWTLLFRYFSPTTLVWLITTKLRLSKRLRK